MIIGSDSKRKLIFKSSPIVIDLEFNSPVHQIPNHGGRLPVLFAGSFARNGQFSLLESVEEVEKPPKLASLSFTKHTLSGKICPTIKNTNNRNPITV